MNDTTDDSESGESERKQIHVKVPQGQKEHWEKFTEQTYAVSTMSDLVRTGVESFIAEEQSETTQEPTGGQGFDTAEVNERLTSLENAIEGLSNKMDVVEEQSQHSYELELLETDVYNVLPPERPEMEGFPTSVRMAYETERDDPVAWSGTIETITEAIFGAVTQRNQQRIKRAVTKLHNEEDGVYAEEIDGELRYWKSDQSIDHILHEGTDGDTEDQ